MAQSDQSLIPLTQHTNGTTQTSRNLPQLTHQYFSAQERSLAEWFHYMYLFSKNIGFFDYTKQQQNGSWQGALANIEEARLFTHLIEGTEVDEDTKNFISRPDMGLLLAFFEMLNTPQQQFDDFTARHKEFYYRQVLGFKEKPALADKVHVVITLNDSTSSKTLIRGTQFDGGEDQDGRKLIYQSLNNAVLNHSQVNKLFTLSKKPIDPNSQKNRLLLTQAYNREQGLEFSPEGILSFGEADINDDERQLSPSLGFTLASPELYLSSGERRIMLAFRLKENHSWIGGSISDYFDVSISTEQELITLGIELTEEFVTYLDSNNTLQESLNITITIDRFFPVIAPLLDENQPLIPTLPCLSFTLKEQHHDKLELLSRGNFINIDMTIQVSGLSGAIASNDIGAIDTSKPFEPFTFSPSISSSFNFTHPELLIKNITQASLDFHWLGRPSNLQEHYDIYAEYRDPDKNESAIWAPNLAQICYSDKPDCIENLTLFSDSEPVNNIDRMAMGFISQETNYQKLRQEYFQLPFTSNSAVEWPRWFSITLSNNDFGHGDYSQVAQYIAYKNINNPDAENTLVPPPYTPILNQLLINYESHTQLTLTDTLLESPESKKYRRALQHIHPLGRPNMSATNSKHIALVPNFTKQGYLYIGVANVKTPGQFRLYFQLDPVDGSNISNDPILEWSYLDSSGWTAFSRSQGGRVAQRGRIIEDSTFNLLDSGIVAFELPRLDLSSNFTGDDLLWIRVSISDDDAAADNVAKYSQIKNVLAQGIMLELMHLPIDQALLDEQASVSSNVPKYYHPSHYAEPLAQKSIGSLLQPDPQIAAISQPYGSFSGKQSETSDTLEIRASERLRHKNRALTAWDFEHLVLAEFPELFMARCYRNNTQDSVDLVVVPVNYDPTILQPKVPLFLKRRIQRFLNTISPPGVNVQVIDPEYEEVAFDVTLNIAQDYDLDSTVLDVNQILIDFMTPWNRRAENNTEQKNQSFVKTIYLTEVAAALERHPGVKVIYTLRAQVKKVFQDISLIPSSNAAILVPVADHKISLLNKEVEVFEGIGKWKIEDDFEIPNKVQ